MATADKLLTRLSRKMLSECGFRPLRFRAVVFTVFAGSTLLLLYGTLTLWTIPRPYDVGKKPRLTDSKPHVAVTKVVRAERNHSTEVKCVHPKLNPYDPAIMHFYTKVSRVKCKSRKNWVYVTNGTFYIFPKAIKKHGEITCSYEPIVRNGDFSVELGPSITPLLNNTPLMDDFFQVRCDSANWMTYTNIHSGVARNPAVMARLHDYHSRTDQNPQKTEPDDPSSPPSVSQHNLSVFIFGFDSMSRMSWIRLLPKTRRYYLDTLGGIELEGYNIVGDGTPAALLPILTGKLEEELPEARRGFAGAKQVDNHPWVWKDFSKRGYVTAWAEDMAHVGTFQYRMLGFRDPPTDHYMRPFYLMAEPQYNRHRPFCLGSTPRHINFMNWFRDLFDMYKDFPKFFFGFHSELSHDVNNPVQALDSDLVNFLKELERKGHLNSTVLILMADHGARFEYTRSSTQGRLEERMPYFSFRFPPWFHKLYPNIIRNMRTNVHRLTTPFDIHATFHDILNYSTNEGDVSNRAISLLKEIPKERTCSHSEVTTSWCACLQWQDINQSDPLVAQAVNASIQTINDYTKALRRQCAELKLQEITKSARYIPNSSDRSAEWVVLKYNNKPPPPVVELYQVSFRTLPGQGHFEVTCTRDVNRGTFSVDAKEISRTNKYGSQPACIQDAHPHLRPYCYCNHS